MTDEPTQTIPTPLDRLQALVAKDRCESCHRFSRTEPAELAARLGVSETTIRRLTSPEYVPGMPFIVKMAAALEVAPLELAGLLWPHLAPVDPMAEAERRRAEDTCEGCGAQPGQQHAAGCPVMREAMARGR